MSCRRCKLAEPCSHLPDLLTYTLTSYATCLTRTFCKLWVATGGGRQLKCTEARCISQGVAAAAPARSQLGGTDVDCTRVYTCTVGLRAPVRPRPAPTCTLQHDTLSPAVQLLGIGALHSALCSSSSACAHQVSAPARLQALPARTWRLPGENHSLQPSLRLDEIS